MRAICILGSPKANGNTAAILNEAVAVLENSGVDTRLVRLGEAKIGFCVGCKTCEQTGKCVRNDDMNQIIRDIYEADIVILASPSYWGDVTAQMKQFIDRCTPYGNTNVNRAPIPAGKLGAAIAVRAGQNKKENENLISTMEHFLGHLDIPLKFTLTVEGVDTREDLESRPAEFERARAFGREIAEYLIG
ncbi:MAG: flavodoxin family protein [Oscillospiraceae bacterium]|jgi:multimeric flavodoxin WrbA|nr:flavodoxin family protein [Oscillospiraceae bacterium]